MFLSLCGGGIRLRQGWAAVQSCDDESMDRKLISIYLNNQLTDAKYSLVQAKASRKEVIWLYETVTSICHFYFLTFKIHYTDILYLKRFIS